MTVVSNDELLGRIRRKRAQVDAYLAGALPRRRRLINATIVGGSLAAALTAAPAVGGQAFTAWLTQLMGLSSPSWRLLCGAAATCSIVSTVATQLLKSHQVEEHVARAQGSRAKLEMIELGLAMGELDARQATSEYLKCVENTAFLGS